MCVGKTVLAAAVAAQNKYPGGIVYGPKAAFNVSAPNGWVLDNESGVPQGQPCVLYPKGESWSETRTVMYAKIASTEFEDVNAFVAWAIKGMKAKHGTPKEKIASGKTKGGTYQAEGNLQEAAKLLAKVNAQTPSRAAFGSKITQLTLERNLGQAVRWLRALPAQFHFDDEYEKGLYQCWLASYQRLAGDTAGAKVTA